MNHGQQRVTLEGYTSTFKYFVIFYMSNINDIIYILTVHVFQTVLDDTYLIAFIDDDVIQQALLVTNDPDLITF